MCVVVIYRYHRPKTASASSHSRKRPQHRWCRPAHGPHPCPPHTAWLQCISAANGKTVLGRQIRVSTAFRRPGGHHHCTAAPPALTTGGDAHTGKGDGKGGKGKGGKGDFRRDFSPPRGPSLTTHTSALPRTLWHVSIALQVGMRTVGGVGGTILRHAGSTTEVHHPTVHPSALQYGAPYTHPSALHCTTRRVFLLRRIRP